MAYLQLGDKKFQLRAGSQRVGPDGSGADIALPGAPPAATAIVTVNADHSVIVRKAGADSELTVNRVPLGAEPSPLIHGDQIALGGHELRFGDDAQAGSTQFISGADLAEVIKARQALPAKPTGATGGRLISLVDGREYTVPAAGLTIGRDASADVVVADTEVSRKHLRIAPTGSSYVLTDLSTNGVWVNGDRVAGERVLGRGDVIKLGAEEFRFYADAAKAAPQATAVPAAPRTPTPPSAVPAVAEPHQAARTVLGVLEILNEGPQKGHLFEVVSPLTNIGRGAHNDLVLNNESVSDSHAKLQKRDLGWFLVDIDSTNGTYVGGRRIAGTQMLSGAPDLRFGDVKLAFRPAADHGDAGKSTRAIVGVTVEEARRIAEQRTPRGTAPTGQPAVGGREAAVAAQAPRSRGADVEAPAAQGASGGSGWVWVVIVVIIAAAAALLLMRGA